MKYYGALYAAYVEYLEVWHLISSPNLLVLTLDYKRTVGENVLSFNVIYFCQNVFLICGIELRWWFMFGRNSRNFLSVCTVCILLYIL